MRYILIILSCILVFGCKKKKAPKSPESSLLVFPNKNSECTTGVSLNTESSQVEFKWQASNHTKTYKLQVSNLTTGITQSISTQNISAKLPLEKGEPYSWIVISSNDETNEQSFSETWNFYNAGTQTTYAPFPAQIIFPSSGGTIIKDINNEVELSWSGADIEEDIQNYEVYFNSVSPPTTLLASLSSSDSEFKVSVFSGTTYFWRIITIDAEGHSSDSGIFDFKVN